MKKIIFVVIASILFGQGYAQVNKFNLSDYKLPVLKRHLLETSFDLSGYNDYFKQQANSQTGYNKQNTSRYYGNIAINYSSYLNKASIQRQVNCGIYLNSNFYNYKQDDTLSYKNYNIYPTLNYSIINRRYNQHNKFIETDFKLAYSFQKSHGYTRNLPAGALYYDSKKHDLIAYLPIKIGTGRIEEVQDARQAIYLLDELAKQKRVKENLKNEDVIALAKLISELKNKRFFDSRIRRIYEIETIDSFLHANNYVLKSDSRYFTTLYDFWDYGNTPYRNSGTRFSASIVPGYYLNDYNLAANNDYYYNSGKKNINAYLINAGLELIHEKPINLNWQNTIEINAFAGTIEGKINNNNNSSLQYNVSIPNIQLGFNHRIGYYPNTRTEMTFSYALNYIQLYGKADINNETMEIEGPAFKALCNLSINYYISPKLRLSIYSSLSYTWKDTKNQSNINLDNLGGDNFQIYQLIDYPTGSGNIYREQALYHDFNIRLTYSIF